MAQRLFFALWPESELQSQLFSLAASWAIPSARQVNVNDIHCTLVFIGEVEASIAGQLQHAAAKVISKPFALTIDCVGWWPQAAVLWAGTNLLPEPLIQLQAQLRGIANELGIRTDSRRYAPHLTLWRNVREAVPVTPFSPVLWPVHAFAIVESVGVSSAGRYRVLNRWPLNGKEMTQSHN
jgi:2'-5' RNA ligase